jgi:predicted nuclease of predicted toxin-antitoxin system
VIGILLDQGLPRSTADLLRSEGWDVLHVGDIGMSRSSDRQILEYARSKNRVIITLDSDFHTILALTNASTPSVIRIRLEGMKGPELAHLIRKLTPRIAPQLKKGAMVSVSDSGIRIRTIPLFGP